MNFSNPLVSRLLSTHHTLSSCKNIVFCWLPSHVGISGNEKADGAAKSSLSLSEAKIKVPHSDLKPLINRYVMTKWQSAWNNAVNNKLHAIKPLLGDSLQSYRAVRRDEVVLARCRIGHSHITHSYLLNREEQPECVFCLEPYTVKHFMIDCMDLALVRQAHFTVDSMHQLFNTISCDIILDYLKQINLYNKI
jgi:kelch-like protein 2/3